MHHALLTRAAGLPDRPPPNPAGGGSETRQGGGGWGMGLYTGAHAAAALRFAGNGGRNLKKRAAIFLFIRSRKKHGRCITGDLLHQEAEFNKNEPAHCSHMADAGGFKMSLALKIQNPSYIFAQILKI